MRLSDFDYYLPPELIAQTPREKRDSSRLLIVDRKKREFSETTFDKITEYLKPGDVLILNDTRVIPARIYGILPNGEKGEILLLTKMEENLWEILCRPAKKFKVGVKVRVGDFLIQIEERKPTGVRLARFFGPVEEITKKFGEIALPPYIKRKLENPNDYQTIFAQKNGGIASPTAGLHFTSELISKIKDMGVEIGFITLHPSLGTFRPIKTESVEEHKMYPEDFTISGETAELINRAKKEGRRVIACGTTSVRALESVAQDREVKPHFGKTELFIYPGYQFKVIDALITNFHLPKSSLLLLVSAFADKELIFSAYRYAIEKRFLFYSFGDAMLII